MIADTIQNFAVMLAKGRPDEEEFLLASGNESFQLPVKILSYAPQSRNIVLTFHGAVDQQVRPIPFYFGEKIAARFSSNATVIAIADPSIRLAKTLLYTWYAGDHEVRTQQLIGSLCDELQRHIEPKKFVFLAGSSGAHPALLHSHAIENSYCIVVNPLTKISAQRIHIDRYRPQCWPKISEQDVFGKLVFDDITDLYASGYRNKVIVLQNCFDTYLGPQVLPLVTALAAGDQFVFLSEFFSTHIGHTYPAEPYDRWIGAVLSDRSGNLVEISKLATRGGGSKPASVVAANGGGASKQSVDSAAIALADRLAADVLSSRLEVI
ncbi:hypothetical protein LXM94_07835 [Rhizobium sp. TRM95111]|uniref:hypothetical protein n=1 Tax=Rhizobium alarense TaxID=2846851 RepID=UPI001F36F956|nr:hypothetical protein [Rhizobium alarense]MCF3639877.1 hypothetical protein [Rhizobium alarense]